MQASPDSWVGTIPQQPRASCRYILSAKGGASETCGGGSSARRDSGTFYLDLLFILTYLRHRLLFCVRCGSYTSTGKMSHEMQVECRAGQATSWAPAPMCSAKQWTSCPFRHRAGVRGTSQLQRFLGGLFFRDFVTSHRLQGHPNTHQRDWT